MGKKILSIGMVLILGILLLILTGCGNQNSENQYLNNTENAENLQDNIEASNSEDGIEIGDNILKYGTYEGKDLAKGTTITLNSDKTFKYEDDKNNSGEGTYEVRSEEIEDIEGTYETWVIEFNSIVIASNDYIPENYYMLFTQTGDISNEEAGLNFDHIEDEENTNSNDILSY